MWWPLPNFPTGRDRKDLARAPDSSDGRWVVALFGSRSATGRWQGQRWGRCRSPDTEPYELTYVDWTRSWPTSKDRHGSEGPSSAPTTHPGAMIFLLFPSKLVGKIKFSIC